MQRKFIFFSNLCLSHAKKFQFVTIEIFFNCCFHVKERRFAPTVIYSRRLYKLSSYINNSFDVQVYENYMFSGRRKEYIFHLREGKKYSCFTHSDHECFLECDVGVGKCQLTVFKKETFPILLMFLVERNLNVRI